MLNKEKISNFIVNVRFDHYVMLSGTIGRWLANENVVEIF